MALTEEKQKHFERDSNSESENPIVVGKFHGRDHGF